MKSFAGRPVIEASDSPLLVDDVLHKSAHYWRSYRPEAQTSWSKTASDAWGAVQTGFGIIGGEMYRPDGEARLYVDPDMLEYALVAYGCERIDQEGLESVHEEIVAIDGLLQGIDAVKAGTAQNATP